MAQGNFTATELVQVQERLSNIFANPAHIQPELMQPAVSASALLSNQTAQAVEILEGGNCVGIKATYLKGNVTEITNNLLCATPGGDEAESGSKAYASAAIAAFGANVKDNRCNNSVDFVNESAIQIQSLIAAARKKLNIYAISKIAANAGANVYTPLPAGFNGVTHTPVIDVTPSLFTWDNVYDFNQVINGNHIRTPILLSGSNFAKEFWKARLSQDPACCDSKQYYAFQQFNMYFDGKDLDATLGGKNTLAVDRDSFIFWNTSVHNFVPTEIASGATGTKYAFIVADPELVYMRNGVATPVLYEVEMEKACSARNSLTFIQNTYKYYLRLLGGFEMAPAASTGQTGALRFMAV